MSDDELPRGDDTTELSRLATTLAEAQALMNHLRGVVADRDALLVETQEALKARTADLIEVHAQLRRTSAVLENLPRRIKRSQIVAAVTASIMTAATMIILRIFTVSLAGAL